LFVLADILFDPSETSPDKISEAIDDMGFDAKVQSVGENDKIEKIKLTISGMSCASCVGKIENHLKKQNGISKAVVALTTSSAIVEFERSEITARKIIQEIIEIGFQAELRNETDNFAILEQKTEIAKWRK